VDQQDTGVITVIPANPCYWLGTRIAALAQGYQNFRPLMFKVSYVPQCAVTQQGNVIAGTLWNTLPSPSNFQQTLRTSPGGMMTQCYKPATTAVTMRSNLQFNLFRCAGKFDQESNPFTYIALAIATVNENNQRIIPGYFYVDYAYTFKNPIGYSHVFFNSGMTTPQQQLDMDYENMALISCTTTDKVALGALIQADVVDNQITYTYNESTVQLQPQQPIWYFCSSTLEYNAKPQPEPEPEEPEPIYINITDRWNDQTNSINSNFSHSQGSIFIIYGDNGQDEDTIQYQAVMYAMFGSTQSFVPATVLHEDFRNNMHFYVAGNLTELMPYIYADSPQTVQSYINKHALYSDIISQPAAELIIGQPENNKVNKNMKIKPIKPNVIEEEEEKDLIAKLKQDEKEDAIINDYLEENDIHGNKEIEELEKKLKALRIQK
jgi:hypothetical protein